MYMTDDCIVRFNIIVTYLYTNLLPRSYVHYLFS